MMINSNTTFKQCFKEYIGKENFSEHFNGFSTEELLKETQDNITIEKFVKYTPAPLQKNARTAIQPSFFRRTLHNFISLFISSFGTNAEEHFVSPFNANTLFEIYLKYLAIPLFLGAQLVSLTGSVIVGSVLTGMIGVSVCLALFVYVKFFKIAPQKIPCGINLLSQKSELEAIERPDIQIDGSPMALLAKPGEGKTSVLKAFAWKHREDTLVYAIRTPALMESFVGMGEHIAYIQTIINSHKEKKKIVLAFEEFDAVLENKNTKLSQLLYQLVDEGITCIPVMSPETYEKIEDESFLRRFPAICLENKGELFEKWYELLLRRYHRIVGGDVYIESTMFKNIMEAAKEEKYSAPASGINLLRRAILWVKEGSPKGALVNVIQVSKIQEELDSYDFLHGKNHILTEVDTQSHLSNERLNQQKQQYETIRKMSLCYHKNQLLQQELAQKIRGAQGRYSSEDERNFILLRRILHVKLQKKLVKLIRKFKQDEGKFKQDEECYFPVSIDKTLIKKLQGKKEIILDK